MTENVRRLFAIYVPKDSETNLDRGLERNTWGLKDSALDIADYRAVAERIDTGDIAVMAYHGPSPRVPVGGWPDARFRRIHIIRFTGPMYRSSEPIWDDEMYPNRLPFEHLETPENPGTVRLSTPLLEELRWSANKGGVPFQVPADVIDFQDEADEDDLDDDLDDRTLGIEGDLDAVVRAIARREQRLIRKRKFGTRTVLTCDLCGVLLPRRFMTAAHIKRRRDANNAERRDLNNIMAACPACDLMFEWGHMTVGSDGRIRVESQPETDDLGLMLKALEGRSCTAWRAPAGSSAYFAWHKANRFRDAS